MAAPKMRKRQLSLLIQAAIFVLVLIALGVAMDWQKIGTSFFQFDKLAGLFPTILTTGLLNTAYYTLISFAFGLALGLILALMKLASFAPYRWIATVYIEFFRGLPALLVLIAFGYGIPIAFGKPLPFAVTVMVAFGLSSAAYIAETLRAGLQAVPKGQMEAARSLGMPHWRAMVTIIIPQAFKIVLPPLTNEFILLTKDTSLVYVLGMTASQYDLTKIGRDGLLSLGAGMTPLIAAGLCYLIITIPLSLLARWFEKRTDQVSRPKKNKDTSETDKEMVQA